MQAKNLLPYRLGVVRMFGTADINLTGLSRGWSYPEDGHVWNDGVEATLNLEVSSASQMACRMFIEGSAYCPKGVDQQIGFFVNGFALGFWKIDDNEPHLLEAEIEPEHWIKRDDKGLLVCVWHLPNSVRPFELGAGNDSRALGFCFRSLLIQSGDTV